MEIRVNIVYFGGRLSPWLRVLCYTNRFFHEAFEHLCAHILFLIKLNSCEPRCMNAQTKTSN